jgi:hypothetical protein
LLALLGHASLFLGETPLKRGLRLLLSFPPLLLLLLQLLHTLALPLCVQLARSQYLHNRRQNKDCEQTTASRWGRRLYNRRKQ